MAISAKSIMNELAQETNLLEEVSSDNRTKLQKTLLLMMQDVHDVCVRNNIRYSLYGGSCLGAVRHKGFIPWDDDIDITMHRDDWEKFKLCFDKELGENYVMEAPRYGNKDCKTTWAKVYKKGTILEEINDVNAPYEKGIFVDIFFYDNVSDNKIIRKFDSIVSDFLKGVATSMVYYKYPNVLMDKFYGATPKTKVYYNMRRFLGFMFSFISHEKFCALYDRFVSRHHEETSCITVPTGRKNYMGEMLQRSWYMPMQLTQFESTEFFVSINCTKYLEKIFGGDYMQLPPEEKRERHFVVNLKFGDEKK